jgi:hypothetical protein
MAGSTEATTALGTCASPAPRYVAHGYGIVRVASTYSTLSFVALSMMHLLPLILFLFIYFFSSKECMQFDLFKSGNLPPKMFGKLNFGF